MEEEVDYEYVLLVPGEVRALVTYVERLECDMGTVLLLRGSEDGARTYFEQHATDSVKAAFDRLYDFLGDG